MKKQVITRFEVGTSDTGSFPPKSVMLKNAHDETVEYLRDKNPKLKKWLEDNAKPLKTQVVDITSEYYLIETVAVMNEKSYTLFKLTFPEYKIHRVVYSYLIQHGRQDTFISANF